VFRARGRRRDIAHDYLTERDGPFRDVQLILLVDEHSASAAEALTGSLQDHDRATDHRPPHLRQGADAVCPSRCPPNGDAVWLTVGWIQTPAGRLIQRRYKGLSLTQYWDMAGRGGVGQDTVEVYRTDHARTVRAAAASFPTRCCRVRRRFPTGGSPPPTAGSSRRW